MIEIFNLNISNLCFKSKILERKIQGLKSLIDIIRDIKTKEYHHLNIAILVNFL